MASEPDRTEDTRSALALDESLGTPDRLRIAWRRHRIALADRAVGLGHRLAFLLRRDRNALGQPVRHLRTAANGRADPDHLVGADILTVEAVIRSDTMTGLTPYLSFPGTAREALTFYQQVFGGALVLNTLADFGRDDGPPDAIAHGMLQGPVELFASDAGESEASLRLEGVLFSLLGTEEPETLERWFAALGEGGTDVDPLQRRPWGDHDGQVTDRFGVRWLIGYQG